jgi:hypothetical protein
MSWADFFRIFNYSFGSDPVSRRQDPANFTGAGVTHPDAIPDLRNQDNWSGKVPLRDTNDFLNTMSSDGRMSRYREYERLRQVAEIEMAMTVMSDESCLAGDTKIATLSEGLVDIKTLAETKKEPFLVYCWDFEKNDYNLGWASDPRLVRTAKTVKIILDDGTDFVATPEHRILRRNGTWAMAGELKFGEELMAFYRVRPDPEMTGCKVNQFPRIYTHADGWMHERQFIDEWKKGKKEPRMERLNKVCRMLAEGLTVRQMSKLLKRPWVTIDHWIKTEGFSSKELKWLGKKADARRIVGIVPGPEVQVYDLSVAGHENFCGESVIFHNCQKGENGHLMKVDTKNKEIKKEIEFLFFHRSMLNLDFVLWSKVKNCYIKGDEFWELVVDPENPKGGVVKFQSLPAETMYRIETTKGKLLEFQQSKDGPDYAVLAQKPVTAATDLELASSRVIRFAPEQVVHFKIGDDRKDFWPYGVSLIESARAPALQLRMMEDAMLVYRLTRAPERRVFYIDVQQLPPFKAEAFIERMKDQFRKKKVATNRGAGASAVDEKWHAPAQDEDYWLPTRPNSNTRIETLPGAQNLGEIDDAKYFRDKLFISLNFPKNYFATEDVQATRIALSAQDVKFARMKLHIEEGLLQIADRHLKLRGWPEEAYEDLTIKLTPPSDWREMSRAEVTTNRYNNAGSLKASQLFSDYDILTEILKYSPEEAKQKIARMKIQKLEELKLQIVAQNPALLGVGVPGDNAQEIGAQPGGPNPMLSPGDQGGQPQLPAPEEGGGQGGETPESGAPAGASLPDPTPEDIRRFDLGIQTYSAEQDREEVDFSVEG